MASEKKKVEIIQEESASWLATFADLATLLFTFYCLIYGSCTYQPGKWEPTKNPALKKMLSVLAGGTKMSLYRSAGDGSLPAYNAVVPLFTNPFSMTPEQRAEVESRINDVIDLAQERHDIDQLSVEATEEGVLFRFSDPIMFGLGMAEPTPASYPFLRAIAAVGRARPCDIRVEGHTDNIPVAGGRWPSNWELSGARAAAIVRFLESQGIGSSSIRAVACGEYAPRAPNRTERERRLNRRVDILLNFRDHDTGLPG